MIRFFQVLAIIAVVWFAASGGVLAQSANQPEQTDTVIEVGSAAASDTEIRQRIDALLAEIDGFDGVDVAVNAGVVKLTGEVLDPGGAEELRAMVSRVEGVVAIENDVAISTDLSRQLETASDRIQDRFRGLFAQAPLLIVAGAVFLGVAAIGWLLTTRIGIWDRMAPNPFIANIYRTFTRILFVLAGLVLALDVLNATALLGAVLGAAGVVGLALGFAVRDTVENFIASVMLSLRQPFRPNDFVEIDGIQGSVARLTSRATILISPEGNHIRIPNATVFKGTLVNYSRNPERRFSFELGVDADSDLSAALGTALSALAPLDFVKNDPPVSGWVKDVGDSNVVLTFTGWIDQTTHDFLKSRGAAIQAAKNALEHAGFGLPEPIYRLKVEGGNIPVPKGESTPTDARPTAPPRAEPLPAAADPGRKDMGAEDAVNRERAAGDTSGNLLDPDQESE